MLTLCTLCCLAATPLAWRGAHGGPKRAFAIGMTGAVGWCAAAAGLSTTPTLAVTDALRVLATTGALTVAASACWMARTADDPHRRPVPADLAVLTVPPVLVLGAVVTNPWHHLVYRDLVAGSGADLWDEGPWYPLVVALLAVPATLCMVHLARGPSRSPAHFRPHLGILLCGAVVVAAAVVVSLALSRPDRNVDVVPVGLAFAAASSIRGFVRHRLLSVVPLARAHVVEMLPDAVVATDAEGMVVDLKASATALLRDLAARGVASAQTPVGQPVWEVMPFLRPAVCAAEAAAGAVDGTAGRVGAAPGTVDAGTVSPRPGLHLGVRTGAIRSSQGALRGYALLLNDISDVVERRLAAERASELLAEEVQRDPLTGLLNRRGLQTAAAEVADHTPRAVVVFDLDHFKAVNDTYGHDVGDTVLSVLSDVLADVEAAHAARGAVAARMGGEEFVLLLPRMVQTEAVRVTEEVLAWVRGTVIPASTPTGVLQISVTASAGVAASPRTHGTPVVELLRQADVALYTAKRAGRDRAAAASFDHPSTRPAAPSAADSTGDFADA
ncbi:diguanylate cyclase [Kineococcus sp. NPDC059986]|uniref:GGDEF domain-containing protein n=1 Tax=Kineococcus sp. NPDC059986 TaxID=3155538 RepID=UPI00344C8D99